ncbi:hypothetical protein F53441_8495 [Fusarium austroafricanum]|uniref:SnoaL-like domain-containing protein n=1 Tax=Fusarium austroafricanum TaxID=2364996 RepID=A0A8H4P4J6_9HYPO|nr:hypothetical protein F53441_8495 [Fusarium austroafricanum]
MSSITELKKIASDFLGALTDAGSDYTNARNLATADISVSHDSYPPAHGIEQFLASWAKARQSMPNFQMKVVDMIAEMGSSGAGGRVWVFSNMSGGKGGEERDSIDMMCINADGKVYQSKDVQRTTVAGKL